jgi:hypothetical protein
MKIRPGAFERLAQRLLREADFDRVAVTGKSGDGGVDGWASTGLGWSASRSSRGQGPADHHRLVHS